MVSPAFVGAGPVAYNATTAWPTSLSVSESTPANVQNGDRALLFVTAFSAGTMTTSCPTPSGWNAVGSGQSSSSVVGSVAMYVFHARWTGDAANASVAPTITTGATNYSWRMQSAAWRPSKIVGDYKVSVGGRFSDNSDVYFESVVPAYGVEGSVAIAAQIVGGGPLSGTRVYTLQVDQTFISGRGGAFRLGDKPVTDNNIFGPELAYSKVGSPSNYQPVICWSGLLDAASEDPSLGTGWSVGQIKY